MPRLSFLTTRALAPEKNVPPAFGDFFPGWFSRDLAGECRTQSSSITRSRLTDAIAASIPQKISRAGRTFAIDRPRAAEGKGLFAAAFGFGECGGRSRRHPPRMPRRRVFFHGREYDAERQAGLSLPIGSGKTVRGICFRRGVERRCDSLLQSDQGIVRRHGQTGLLCRGRTRSRGGNERRFRGFEQVRRCKNRRYAPRGRRGNGAADHQAIDRNALDRQACSSPHRNVRRGRIDVCRKEHPGEYRDAARKTRAFDEENGRTARFIQVSRPHDIPANRVGLRTRLLIVKAWLWKIQGAGNLRASVGKRKGGMLSEPKAIGRSICVIPEPSVPASAAPPVGSSTSGFPSDEKPVGVLKRQGGKPGGTGGKIVEGMILLPIGKDYAVAGMGPPAHPANWRRVVQ